MPKADVDASLPQLRKRNRRNGLGGGNSSDIVIIRFVFAPPDKIIDDWTVDNISVGHVAKSMEEKTHVGGREPFKFLRTKHKKYVKIHAVSSTGFLFFSTRLINRRTVINFYNYLIDELQLIASSIRFIIHIEQHQKQ